MANHKSAIKRHRQSLKRRDRNREVKNELKAIVKKVRTAAGSGDKAGAQKFVVEAEKQLAKAAGKSIIHKANAQRRISRLMALVNKA